MGIPALIFVLALGAGLVGSARALPRLADDRVGRLAFWTVCLLLGIALAVVGLDVYGLVRDIQRAVANLEGTTKPDILASGVSNILEQVGPVIGLAAAVYLLAPAQESTID